jgi:hypothetical protein
LSVASYSFLVSITQRQQVAQIQGHPIYSVTNVAIIPISSQADASRAIAQAKKESSQEEATIDSSSDEDDLPDNETDTAEAEAEIGSLPASPNRNTSHVRGNSIGSIAEDVLVKKVRFGRFAANWLSRKNLGLPRPGALEPDVPESPFDETSGPSGDASEAAHEAVDEVLVEGIEAQSDAENPKYGQAAELLPKLLRYTKLLFASHNFFFAYDYDLTRSLHMQEARKDRLPLHKVVDPLVCLNLAEYLP